MPGDEMELGICCGSYVPCVKQCADPLTRKQFAATFVQFNLFLTPTWSPVERKKGANTHNFRGKSN